MEQEEYQFFADWLRAELKKRGWRQADLARRIGKADAYVSRLLNQTRMRPEIETVAEIARALGYPPEMVYPIAGYHIPGIHDQGFSPTMLAIIRIVSVWPPERQRLLYEIVAAIERAPTKGVPREETDRAQ